MFKATQLEKKITRKKVDADRKNKKKFTKNFTLILKYKINIKISIKD